jgi:hypothetical protein
VCPIALELGLEYDVIIVGPVQIEVIEVLFLGVVEQG